MTTLLIDHVSTTLNQSNRCGLYIWLLGIVTSSLCVDFTSYSSCPGGCTPHGPCLPGWNLSTTVWPKETACCQRHTKPPVLGCHHCPSHLHSLPSLIKVLTSFSEQSFNLSSGCSLASPTHCSLETLTWQNLLQETFFLL